MDKMSDFPIVYLRKKCIFAPVNFSGSKERKCERRNQLFFADRYVYLLIKSTKCATVTYLGTDFSVKSHKTNFYF